MAGRAYLQARKGREAPPLVLGSSEAGLDAPLPVATRTALQRSIQLLIRSAIFRKDTAFFDKFDKFSAFETHVFDY